MPAASVAIMAMMTSIANKSTDIFFEQTRKQKTPPERGFYQGFAVGRRRTHCVTSTQKSIRDRRRTRNSGTDFDVFEYGSPSKFCP
jgi:hypothetical protein